MGENGGFLQHLRKVDRTTAKLSAAKAKHPNASYVGRELDRASLLAGYKEVLLGYLNPDAGVSVTGFKARPRPPARPRR